jgi:tetratricopeptide (TPR) repeat protein
VSPVTYLFNQTEMIVAYLRLTFWPTDLVLDYGFPFPMSLGEALPHGLVILSLLVATAVLWKVAPPVACLGTWFFTTLAPTSSFVPLAAEVGAERRMYLPLAALSVLVAWVGYELTRRVPPSRWKPVAAPAVLAVTAVILSVLTWQRNAEYQGESYVWQTVWERYPHARALYNLGQQLELEGRRDEAIQYYHDALDRFPEAHYFIGIEFDEEGRYDEAIERYRAYLRAIPDDALSSDAYARLQRALISTGQLQEAAKICDEVLARHPDHGPTRLAFADILRLQGQFEDAVGAYAMYLGISPADAGAHNSLGLTLISLGRDAEAVQAFGRAVQLSPVNSALIENLATGLARIGRFDEAVTQYGRAIQIDPLRVGLHVGLGQVLAVQGRSADAMEVFRRALRMAGSDPAARDEATQALERLMRQP